MLSDVRAFAAVVPIAIDSVELFSVAVESVEDIRNALEAAREMFVLSAALELSALDMSVTTTESEPDMLVKALSALETWALVGEPASTTSEDMGADSSVARLVALLASTVTVERLELSTSQAEVPADMPVLAAVAAEVAVDRVVDSTTSAESTAERLALADWADRVVVVSPVVTVAAPALTEAMSRVTVEIGALSAKMDEVATETPDRTLEIPVFASSWFDVAVEIWVLDARFRASTEAVDRSVDSCRAVEVSAVASEVVASSSVETVTWPTASMPWSDVAVASTVLRLTLEDVVVDRLDEIVLPVAMAALMTTDKLALVEVAREAPDTADEAVLVVVLISVDRLSTVEVAVEALTTAVLSDADMLAQALLAEETWALVGVAPSRVAVERLLDRVASMLVVADNATESVLWLVETVTRPEVTAEMLDDSVGVTLSAVEMFVLVTTSLDSAAEMLDDSTTFEDVAVEMLVLSVVRPIVAVDRSLDTEPMTVLSDTSAEVTVDPARMPREMPAPWATASTVQVDRSLLTPSGSAMPPIVKPVG